MTSVCETEHLIVVDKPAGWLTVPARLKDDPRPVLGLRLQEQVGVQIFPVHRLDFEVSGLTLWAKTAEAHREAQRWFEEALVEKTYQAWSRPQGEPPRSWVEWTSRLVRGKRRSFKAAHGKDSRTRARVIAVEDGRWLWELQPVTGRPHQLRVEMASHGHPILGDVLYGGEKSPRADWIALRAVKLDFQRVAERFGLPVTLEISPLT